MSIVTKGYGSKCLITKGYGISVYAIILKAATRIFTIGVSIKQFTIDSAMRVFTKVTDRRSF